MSKNYNRWLDFRGALQLEHPDIKSDLRTVLFAIAQLLVMGIGVAFWFVIVWWDASGKKPFTESGPTEITQSVVLAIATILYFWEARRNQVLRKGLVLVSGLLGCMLIREQDYFLDMIIHGFWKWPAFTLAFFCIAYAIKTPVATLSSLATFVRNRSFSTFLAGLVIVLSYSRIFGTTLLWKALLPDGDWRIAKYAVEESSELLGYLFILFSVVSLRHSHKR